MQKRSKTFDPFNGWECDLIYFCTTNFIGQYIDISIPVGRQVMLSHFGQICIKYVFGAINE